MPQPAVARPLSDGRLSDDRPNLERSISDRPTLTEVPGRNESLLSGVSWQAVAGGAFVSASLVLILLALGSGLGFSSVSPWANSGASAATLGKAAILWLILTQILSSAMGGYLAGRLRTKWANVHTDEVYFRDTAHGLLVWAVSLVLSAAFLVSTATTLASGHQAPTNASNAVANDSLSSPQAYYVDMLLRGNETSAATNRSDASERNEVDRILTHALAMGSMPAGDDAYLAQMVSARSGLNNADADKRVTDVFNSAQQAADSTRKGLAHLSLWLFVALLSGAFCASYAGIIGGRQRDRVAPI